MTYKVFFSHCEQDTELVQRICNILNNIYIECYIYEFYPEYGEYVAETVKNNVQGCSTVIVLLTEDGVQSQWVNQEMGVAFALGKLVIPIVEKNVVVKGFVEARERIDYDKNDPDDVVYTIYRLITRLRGLHPTNNIKLFCMNKKCDMNLTMFSSVLPTEDEINNAIERDLLFEYKCPSCAYVNYVFPRTLEQDFDYPSD